MPVEEDNLHSIVSLIQMVGLLRGSSSTRESSLLSTKLYYWEDQSLECFKKRLDYLPPSALVATALEYNQ